MYICVSVGVLRIVRKSVEEDPEACGARVDMRVRVWAVGDGGTGAGAEFDTCLPPPAERAGGPDDGEGPGRGCCDAMSSAWA